MLGSIEIIATVASSLSMAMVTGLGIAFKRQFSNGGVKLNRDEQEARERTHSLLIEMGSDVKHIQSKLDDAHRILIDHISDRAAHS